MPTGPSFWYVTQHDKRGANTSARLQSLLTSTCFFPSLDSAAMAVALRNSCNRLLKGRHTTSYVLIFNRAPSLLNANATRACLTLSGTLSIDSRLFSSTRSPGKPKQHILFKAPSEYLGRQVYYKRTKRAQENAFRVARARLQRAERE